ncbi:Polyamine aminopropyltransferase [Methylocystis sp. MJC1]|uniref:spermine/spermidine synthase domain-containing protein n=1 Tax=Methylocystis sp. MJC1 TaxID=2654282 RepID=UPI0013EAE918|nr:spermidine synthase [Methylocystis sp. MJC1]KAF2990856.1 Polyamine aminopropyltransferase [Methylocystis sp. MJC1]MBU6527749.1 spermidine synthase [Methylocystis sp. MJC1]
METNPPERARGRISRFYLRWALVPIVLASGFAGLGYEIVWTRMLSLALGSEMMAVLGVVAGFFSGLALGAFVLDPLIRKARAPCRAYAALEAAIGTWAVVSAWLLPGAARIMPELVGAEPSPLALWFASFALPALALLPATAAMGGTLTALDRLTATIEGDAHASAGVYGANTAGAVAGALACAFLLVPQLGLSNTLFGLAGLNALCAFGALALQRDTDEAAEPTILRPAPDGARRLTITLFATGLLGIAFETLVVRLAAQILQDTVYTFAALLAAYLLGVAAGGLLWQRFGRQGDHSSLGWLLAASAFSCLLTAAFAPFGTPLAEGAAASGVIGEFAVAIAFFLLPSCAMGALFGYLAQQARDARGSLGWAVGVNSLGAALAPLATALILIPSFGVWRALALVALGYLLLLPLRQASLIALAAPALLGVFLFIRPEPSLIRPPNGGAVLATREGPMATASVVDDAAGVRYLDINGHFRMGGTSSARSDYRQAILPLLLHPAPHRALFLGVGTGATLIGGAMMPGVEAHGVELLPEVVELLPWFANETQSVALPKVTVADARRYVTADREHHDVIIADLFHPALDGSGALYTTEHFAAVRERLAPGGIFCQWLPLYQLDLPSLRAIIRSFLEVYPGGSAWLNHYSVRTPMLALVGPRDAGAPAFDTLATRLDEPSLAAVVRPLGFIAPIDLLGQFLGGPRALAAFAGDGPRNTDDRPFVTFDAHRNVAALTAPPWKTLLAVSRGMITDAGELLPAGRQDAFAARLASYWRARNRFLEAGAALPGEPRGRALIDAASQGLLETLRQSEEFEPAYGPLISMARALIASDRAAGVALLREIDAAAPMRGAARELLARDASR